MTDSGHHGEGEHHQRYVPMPAMPGAALIAIEAEFVLGGLEAVFDGPATAFHRDQFFRGRAHGAPGGEERQARATVAPGTSDRAEVAGADLWRVRNCP